MKNSTLEQQQSIGNSIEDKSLEGKTFGSMQELSLSQLALIAGGVSDEAEAGPNEPGSGDRDIGGLNPNDYDEKP